MLVHHKTENQNSHIQPLFNNSCLIEEMVGLLSQCYDPTDIAGAMQIGVILPTYRLVSATTLALAARFKRAALVPPRFWSLTEFIREFFSRAALLSSGSSTLAPRFAALPMASGWSTSQIEQLLHAMLTRSKTTYEKYGIKDSHAHEITQFFHEIESSGQGAEGVAKLEVILCEDVYRSDVAAGRMRSRFQGLQVLYSHLQSELSQRGVLSATALEQRQIRLLLELFSNDGPDKNLIHELLPARTLFFGGFTSLLPLQAELLQTLVRAGVGKFLLSLPPESQSASESPHSKDSHLQSPLGRVWSWLASASRSNLADETYSKRTPVVIQPCAGITAEVAFAALTARQAVDQGIKPSRIAVIVPNESLYALPLYEAFSESGRPDSSKNSTDSLKLLRPNLAVPIPAGASRFGRLVRSLLNVIADYRETQLHSLAGFLGHPDVKSFLHRDHLPSPETEAQPGEKTEAQLLLSWLVGHDCYSTADIKAWLKIHASGDERETPATSPENYWLRIFLALNPLLEQHTKHGDWSNCLAALRNSLEIILGPNALALEGKGPGKINNSNENRIEELARTEFAQFCKITLGHAQSGEQSRDQSFGAFQNLVEQFFLSVALRPTGDPFSGIQILSLPEARYIPFDVAIVLGCYEGSFPRALPNDTLVDQFFRNRLGLPGWQYLEALEDTTFALLRARIKNLVLTFPRHLLGGEPTVRSRFVDRLVAESAATEKAVFSRDVSLVPEACPENAPLFEGSGDLTHETSFAQAFEKISASALEAFIKCPLTFRLRHFGVQEIKLPDPENPATEGSWLHEVLAAFFTGQIGNGLVKRRLLPELAPEIPIEKFEAIAVERLRRLTDMIAPPSFREQAMCEHLSVISWPRFAAHLGRIANTSKDGKNIEFSHLFAELRLAHLDASVTFGTEAGKSRVQGSIDSLIKIQNHWLLTDYKRSRAPTIASIAKGTQPQLPFYALAVAPQLNQLMPNVHPTQLDRGHPQQLDQIISGYWNIIKGEWVHVGTGSEEADRIAQSLGLASPRGKPRRIQEQVKAFQELWDWRRNQILQEAHHEAQGQFLADSSLCGQCRNAGICRRDDPQRLEEFSRGRRLETHLKELSS